MRVSRWALCCAALLGCGEVATDEIAGDVGAGLAEDARGFSDAAAAVMDAGALLDAGAFLDAGALDAAAPDAAARDAAAPDAAAPDAATPPPLRCPTIGARVELGHVADMRLVELSGLAAGRVNPGVVWTHGD